MSTYRNGGMLRANLNELIKLIKAIKKAIKNHLIPQESAQLLRYKQRTYPPLMSASSSYRKLLEAIALSWCRRHRPESESTDWGQSLLAFGLLRSLPNHNNPEVREYLRRWIYFHLNEGVHVNYFCGSWSFALLYPEIAEEFPEVRMQLATTAEMIYDTIMHKSLRNGDGMILHNIDLPNIYIDTVYYSSALLAKLGKFLARAWEDEALLQIDRHLTVLKDANQKFYIHCEENLTGKRSEGSWARGNGWVMMTYAEVLSYLRKDHPDWQDMAENFKTIGDNLLQHQTVNGLWRTIIDEPDAYEEVSASAMYLFAMQRGRALGILGNEFDMPIAKAAGGIRANINSEHKVLGVSEGTWPGTKEYYKSLSRGEWWWGTGATLLALAELVRRES